MDPTVDERPMVSTSRSDSELRRSEPPPPDATFFDRLKQMPLPIVVAVTYDLVINLAFHIITIIVLVDLHILNYTGTSSLILEAPYFDPKAHFWTLFGCSLDLNLNTTSIIFWGLLVFAIGRGDPSWAKAWVTMKRIVIFLMLPHNAAIAFGGENSFAIFNCVFFFSYYLLSVLTIEVISKYYIPPENKDEIESTQPSS